MIIRFIPAALIFLWNFLTICETASSWVFPGHWALDCPLKVILPPKLPFQLMALHLVLLYKLETSAFVLFPCLVFLSKPCLFYFLYLFGVWPSISTQWSVPLGFSHFLAGCGLLLGLLLSSSGSSLLTQLSVIFLLHKSSVASSCGRRQGINDLETKLE